MDPAPNRRVLGLILGLALMSRAPAHDIWIEANQTLVRLGEQVNLALMLGNHGNHHRDFKLASKIPAGQQSLRVMTPEGTSIELTPNLIDNGYEPKEGFWSTTFLGYQPGIYQAISTFDQVMSFAPVRDIKCAKTFFGLTGSLDKPVKFEKGFGLPIGAPLELIAVSNPVYGLGNGSVFTVRLLFKGKPLPETVVSFIPKGVTLTGDIDPRYEVKTDAMGIASFTLCQSGQWLIAAHAKDDSASGEGYKSIGFSATLHLQVPAVCPCCAGGQ